MKTYNEFLNEAKPDNTAWYKIKIMNYFAEKEKFEAPDLEELSKITGLTVSEVHQKIYDIMSSFFYYGKYNNYIRENGPLEIDERQVDVGIRFEYEHTNDPVIARRISLDHLVSDKLYYTHLSEMEQKYSDD